MTRSHRWAHRVIWPVLAFVVGIGFAVALYGRPAPDPSSPAAVETLR